MPVRRTVRPQERVAPYQHIRKSSTMATAVISPQPWQGMHHHHTPNLTWQPQPQMHAYPPSTLLNDYTTQTLTTPSLTVNHIGPDRRTSNSLSSGNNDGGPWTAEMDNILIDAQARGMRWEQISQVYFPHKSANACRKRYGRAKEERRATDWDEARIGRVIAIYNREGFRERLWGQLASEAGERWQDIEKLVYSQGLTRMVRGRGSHSRSRSRASVGHNVNDEYDQRYHSSEDYDSRDDSGIGLGLITDHHGHGHSHSHSHSHNHLPPSTHVVAPSVSSGAPIDMLIQPSHGYSYAS